MEFKKLLTLMIIWLIVILPLSNAFSISGLSEEGITGNSATITWETSVLADSEIQYGITPDRELSQTNSEFSAEHSMTLIDLEEYAKYYYRVISRDENDTIETDESSFETLGSTAPPKVEGLAVKDITEESISLTWDHVGSLDLDTYFVYRDGLNIKNITNNIYLDEFLSSGTPYQYKVSAMDDFGNLGEFSESLSVTTLGEGDSGDVTPPTFEVIIPTLYNAISLDVEVNTEAFVDVKVYVNDIFRKGNSADADGYILLENILLSSALATNIIKIVVEDFAGNIAEQEYPIQMDFEDPELIIQTNVENVTTDTLSIEGYVNEECTIDFFIDLIPFDTTPPEQVVGLVMEDVREESISLTWAQNEDEDLWYYLIYREDVGLLGISSTNNYVDDYVITGQIYDYWVSAVDRDCIEGESSELVEIKSLEGEQSPTELTFEAPMPECNTDLPDVSLETSGSFNQALTFGQGVNNFMVRATDAAGNSVSYNYTTAYDTQAPFFEETNLGSLNPTYNERINVHGKVSEPAMIYVYLNEDETAVATTETENDGSFNVNVKLSKENEILDGEAWENYVKIKAVDIAGIEAEAVNRIELRRCGGGLRLFRVVPKDLVPNELTPRLLLEGMSQITLNLDLEWMGSGMEPYLKDASVSFLQLNIEQEEHYDSNVVRLSDYEITDDLGHQSVAIIASINDLEDPTPTGENWSQYMKEKNISQRHDGNCFSNADVMSSGLSGLGAIDGLGCIKLPLEVTLSYDMNEGFGDYEDGHVIQKECIFVDVLIQPPYDMEDLYNKKMLESMVDFIDAAVDVLDAVIEPVEAVTEWVFAGCLLGTAFHLVKKWTEVFSCGEILVTTGLGFDVCNDCTINDDGEVICGDPSCESCIGAKLSTLKVERITNVLCDRISCNSIPSFETYAKNQAAYSFNNAESACSSYGEDDFSGYTEKMVGFSEDAGTTAGMTFDTKPADLCNVLPTAEVCAGSEEYCVQQYVRDWDSSALFMNEFKESLCSAPALESGLKEKYCSGTFLNIFQGVRDFKLCKDDQEQNYLSYRLDADNYLYMIKVKEGEEYDVWEMLYKFRSYEEGWEQEGQKDPEEETEENLGEFKFAGPVKTIPSQKIVVNLEYNSNELESALYNFEGQDILDFFGGTNVVAYTREKCGEIVDGNLKYGEADWPRIDYPEEYEPQGYKTLITNPAEYYIKLPQPIANFICSDFEPQQTHILNPSGGLFKALQAVCLPAISGYLSRTRNILATLRGCFNHILITGDGSAGYCQQFLSQYVCDLIYYTLNCVGNLVPDTGERQISTGIGGWGQYLIYSMQEIQQGVRNRYGTTSPMSAILNGKEVFNSVCALMFGADVDLSLDTLMDLSGVDTPIEPFVGISGATRRFTGINHQNGLTTNVYNVFALAVTEQEITYSIALLCSDDYSCEISEGFEQGKCDCVENGQPKRVYIKSNERLGEGQSLSEEYFEEVIDNGYRYDKVEFQYSYIIGQGGLLGQQGERVIEEVTAPISQIGSFPPTYCFFRLDPFAEFAEFRCSISSDERAKARFIDPSAGEEKNAYGENRDLRLGDDIISEEFGTDFSFDIDRLEEDDYGNKMPVYLVFELLNENDELVLDEFEEIYNEDFYRYNGEEGLTFPLSLDYFRQGGDSGYTCSDDWCITNSNLASLIYSTQLKGMEVKDGRESDLYLRYDSNTKRWGLYQNRDDDFDDPSNEDDNALAISEPIVVKGDVTIICDGINPPSGVSGEYDKNYKIEIFIEDYDSFEIESNDAFTIEYFKDGGEGCDSEEQKFEMNIILYNSVLLGNTHQMDDTRPVVYNGEEQEITINFEALCSERENEEETTEE